MSTRARAPDGVPYDLFVSYRQREPDLTWVRNRLVPCLRKRGVRVCIDYEAFQLGVPLVPEMERAVKESRYTVAVLTPRYLESNFTELENVLAQHFGLKTSTTRLLAVMREPCSPRLSLQFCCCIDLTDDTEFEVGCARLAHKILAVPDR